MSEEIQKLIDQREADYPSNLEKARELLLEAVKDESQAASAYTLLAQVQFWLGDYAEDNDKKEQYFSDGVEYGKQAVELNPAACAAHMWYASNMGQHGLVRGIMSSLFYLGPIEQHAKKAVELDESYFQGGPLRLLGRFYHQAPGWPVGPGDNKKALSMLEKAVQIAPDMSYNHLYLADLLISRSKKKEAADLLEKIKTIPDQPGMEKMFAGVRKEAEQLAAKL